MHIGLTQIERDGGRERLQKKLKTILLCFWIACLAPLVIWLLFSFDIVHSAPVFSSDIQQPVVKVQTSNAIGTAFLVSPTKLLTARHVVEGMKKGDKVQVFFEKLPEPRNVTATILFIAPSRSGSTPDGSKASLGYFLDDIAVLEIAAVNDITPLDLGASDVVSPLDEVVLIGYPGGDYSITKGNINSDKFENMDLFKLDATANPGNSGGPVLLKEDNSVIGILVGSNGPGFQGQNIATKINTVRDVLKKQGIDIIK